MERKVAARRTVQGVVVSDKNDKTIVVLIETHRRHPKYGKRVKYGKKFYAHDESLCRGESACFHNGHCIADFSFI